MFLSFISALRAAVYTVYREKEQFRDRPLKGLLQTVQVILYFVGGLGERQMAAISVVYPLGQVVVGLGLLLSLIHILKMKLCCQRMLFHSLE